jgi:hypothetical protein
MSIHQPDTRIAALARPGSVPFRAELPDELSALQLRLDELTREVGQCCREGEPGRAGERLGALSETLYQYLVDEGLQFEPYMRYALEGDVEALELMRVLRTRLRELAREVHDVSALCVHRGDGTRTLRVVDEFMTRVGPELAQCLERQRTLLFPRYVPVQRLGSFA